ncbi:MAG: redoxin domain-containing protein [Candidatus Kapabacteria bacterium]|nr:redoxin domain-containing protein [Candidatus Kapabacteria bacterium]
MKCCTLALLVKVLLACVGHAQGLERPLPAVLDTAGNSVNIVAMSDTSPVIAVRFLGSMCTHCMQQLSLMKQYTQQLRALGARVVAFSQNDVSECREVSKQYGFADDVFLLCSDADNRCSRSFGTTITERDSSITELHGLRIFLNRRVVFEHYSMTPFMDIPRLLAILSRKSH